MMETDAGPKDEGSLDGSKDGGLYRWTVLEMAAYIESAYLGARLLSQHP
jgi:hypothetical protein